MLPHSRTIASSVIFVLIFLGTPAGADDNVNVTSLAGVGDTFQAPTSVTFVGINPVAYFVALKKNAIDIAGPNAPTGFTPPQGGTPPKVAVSAFKAISNACGQSDPAKKFECDLNLAKTTLSSTPADIETLQAAVATAINSAYVSNPSIDPAVSLADKYVVSDLQILIVMSSSTLDADLIAYTGATAADKKSVDDFKKSALKVTSAFGDLDATLAQGDFQRTSRETCSFQGLGGRTTTFTLTLTSRSDATKSQSFTATASCPMEVTASGGVIFTTLPQRNFVAQTTNGSSPPTATVQIGTSSNTAYFGMVHLRLACVSTETCFYLSPGAGITVSGQANLAYGIGPSVGLFQYLFVTAGYLVGPYATPQPGYDVNNPIAVGAAVPTITASRGMWFIGFTFGPQK